MLVIKALHVIAVVAWFAGLLYLPRLLAYHAECADVAGRVRFAVMERRLYWRIMLPAMVAALFFGLMLLGFGVSGGWIAAKLALVALLVGFHLSLGVFMGRFAAAEEVAAGGGTFAAPRSGRFFRIYNEAPAVLLVAIVVLAVVKPF